MTRYLSEALGAEEPTFSQGIQQLEQASGLPSADIRLSALNMQQARLKITALGLDPNDTTAEELYAALHRRLERDEGLLRSALNIPDDAAPTEVLARVEQYLDKSKLRKECFALKSSVAKQLLKKKVPKNAMKKLGYRSVESMLKHEPVAQLYAAAVMAESPAWHKAFREQYSKLQPSDFEMRPMAVCVPQSKRWLDLGASFVASAKHNMLTFKELGSVVALPFSSQVDGFVTTSLLLHIHELNEIRSFSSFAKLQQVKPDFGLIVRSAALGEPQIAAHIAGQHVTWQTIHRFYAQHIAAYEPDIFEPHVQADDLTWQRAEDELVKLSPALQFWQGTQHLTFVDHGRPVSFNMLDVALSYCNHLSFADRIVHFMRNNLWHELMSRYLNHKNIEMAVEQQLSQDMLPQELALAE